MVQQLKSPSNGSTGDANNPKVGYVFYNFHSVTLPRSDIENLIQFVTSQLALTLLRFFFCCDARHTPDDVIRLMEENKNCEVLQISNQQSASGFEEEISKRALNVVAGIESGLLVLVTDEGNYHLLFDELGGDWDLGIFHPADTDPAFHSLADIAIQLPIDKEQEETEPLALQEDTASEQMHELKRTLMKMLERMKEINKKVAEQSVKKATDYVVKVAVKKEDDVPKKSGWEDAHKREDNGWDGNDRKKTGWDDDDYVKEEETMPKAGLGWDSFPAADLGLKTSGWDEEVHKEMEAEKAWMSAAGPFPPAQQERKNPFGGNPFEAKSKKPGGAPKMAAPPLVRAPSFNHRQEHFEPRVQEDGNHMTQRGEGPFGYHHQQQPQPAPWKEARNPFGGGVATPGFQSPFRGGTAPSSSKIAGGPNFRKPGPQCPQWEDRSHRASDSCPLWHPFKQCLFYPMCRATAANCGYAHPFCTDGECQCPGQIRDAQLNHFAGFD